MRLLARPNCGTGSSRMMVRVVRGAPGAQAYHRAPDAARGAVARAYHRAPDAARGSVAQVYHRAPDAARGAVAQVYHRAPDQAALDLSSSAARTQLRAHDRVQRLVTVH